MKTYDCQQGSQEWLRLRAGVPTASQFDSILTPGGKPSTSAVPYMHKLLVERILGRPTVEFVSTWMERGHAVEAEAVSFYEFQRDVETVKVGFMTNDAGTIGASPDRLIPMGDGLLEIKVPSPHIHLGYLIGNKTVDEKYKPQVQGQLWIAEKEWLDIVSYHPEMPPALIRVQRDEEYISKLAAVVTEFSRILEETALELKARGIIPARKPEDEIGPLGITMKDAEALLYAA